jgi:hypothetical protein
MGDKEEARERLAMEMARQQQSAGVDSQRAHMERIMAKNVLQTLQHVEDQMDEDLAKLTRVEDMKESELDDVRERRKEQLRKQASKKAEWIAQGHGSYGEVRGEKEFFAEVKGSERVVVHFYRSSTVHCQIIDRHLSDLSKMHMETKFLKINAEQSPFLVERLRIWMMPSIVIALNGKTEHTIVGLDEFGGGEEFSTEMAAYVLGQHKAIFHDGVPPTNAMSNEKQTTRFTKAGAKTKSNATLADDDWWD